MLELDAKTCALVLIDLQHAIVGRPGLAPHAGGDVVARCNALAAACRAKGATVVYVHVDLAHMLQPPVDQPMRDPSAPVPPPSASELAPAAGYDADAGDLLVTKRQWGAFFGTNLEAQLRDRGIETVILAGIATNFGVESTGRAAQGLGFALVVVEDACTTMSAAMHAFAIEQIFPRIARVRSTNEVIAALR